MFKINRRPEPTWMQSTEFRDVRRRLLDFHSDGGTRLLQRRFPLLEELAPFEALILESLHEQFDGRCAYSEVGTSSDENAPPLRLIWHRPTNDAADLEGRVHSDHYWWLTLDWENWYLASAFVESVKSYQFPVAGERTPLTQPLEERSVDRGLLLDPVSDEPTWWLRFRPDGSVQPRLPPSVAEREHFSNEHRGELTIRILGLDSERLREGRRAANSQLEQSDLWAEPGAAIVDHVIDGNLAHRGALLQRIVVDRVGLHDGNVDQGVFGRLVERAPDVLGAELLDNDSDATVSLAGIAPAVRDELADRLVVALPDVREVPRFTELFAARQRSRGAASTAGVAVRGSASRAWEKKSAPPTVSIGPTDRLSRVLIKDFRAIRQIEFTVESELVVLPPKVDEHLGIITETAPLTSTQWKVLLGENGSGKSSILHAIALALSGDRLDEFLAAAGLDWSGILRRTDDANENVQGRVLLEFTGGQVIDLRFTDSTGWFHGLGGEAPAMHVNVRAYGATRLLRRPARHVGSNGIDAALTAAMKNLLDPDTSRSERLAAASECEALLAERKNELTVHPRSESENTIDIGNLLDSSVPVIDATRWLCDLDDPSFNVAALTLSDLLGESSMIVAESKKPARPQSSTRIRRRIVGGKTKIFVDNDSLAHVSDGYRSVIAVACDIMQGIGGLDTAGGGVSDLARARGIVLIDEVGAHLHPRWRMQITDRLRRAFPNVQFLISTHEPLCLRGLQENEVIKVSKYEQHGVVLQDIEMSPARYRVDQLLTSDFFGLDSAIDPEVDALFKKYYKLQSEQRPEDPISDELRQLDKQMSQQRLRPVLGYTRRDQMMYEAIDLFLAEEPMMGDPDERQRARKATVEKVADQWLKMARLRR